MRLIRMVLAAAMFFPAFSPAMPATVAELVSVGAAKVDITPETPVRMYGYAARKTESDGVAGPLKASALAIGGDEGDGPAVLLAVDCGAVPADLRAEVVRRAGAAAGVKPERLMLCNSHNHSGPNLRGVRDFTGQELEHITRYAEQLTERLERVVVEALKSRRPGRLAWTQGSVGFAANRRVLKDGKWAGFGAVPEGAVDHSLPLLRVTDVDGALIALVVNYACHSTTLRGNFRHIHGDWAGSAQESIEADFPGAVALVTIGCGADSDPCPHGTVELCEQHGRALADEVKRLMAGPFTPVDPRIVARRTVLEIAMFEPPPLEELKQRAAGSYAAQRMLKRIERGEALPASQTYEIHAWTFGDDLAMVFLPNEVVVDYSLRLKRELDGSRLWINAYSNDISYYVVSKRLIGEGGYEVRNSLSTIVSHGRPEQVEPAVEDRIVGAITDLLPESFRAEAIESPAEGTGSRSR